MKLRTYSVIKN